MHSSNHLILYAGYTAVYKTTDGGTSWNSGTNAIGGQYLSMAVAPSNGNYVYAAPNPLFTVQPMGSNLDKHQ
jgi:photosystem II stability/assembly factor-like uncharacterized protein